MYIIIKYTQFDSLALTSLFWRENLLLLSEEYLWKWFFFHTINNFYSVFQKLATVLNTLLSEGPYKSLTSFSWRQLWDCTSVPVGYKSAQCQPSSHHWRCVIASCAPVNRFNGPTSCYHRARNRPALLHFRVIDLTLTKLCFPIL